ncbi:hypothetical protein PVAP13_4KG131905 [Panicum virgatum]|uniref:Uncharacterized protein n=1 Tax=Panicum virgatum TaxID=38727 RepID=A0A8T0TTW5_PANVG|nr:hypothetical protein PVAP13_4KG131905 [Panicum virgatum]
MAGRDESGTRSGRPRACSPTSECGPEQGAATGSRRRPTAGASQSRSGSARAVAAQPSSPPPAALNSSSPVRLPSIPCARSLPVLSSTDSGPHPVDSLSAGPPWRSSIATAAGCRCPASSPRLPTLHLAGELRRALGQLVRARARPPLGSWLPTPAGRRAEPPHARRAAGMGAAPWASVGRREQGRGRRSQRRQEGAGEEAAWPHGSPAGASRGGCGAPAGGSRGEGEEKRERRGRWC